MRQNESPAVPAAGRSKAATVTNHRRIYYNAAGRPVATLAGHVLRKRVRASVHMLRKPPAWAVDVSILEAARRDGATRIEVEDAETKRIYTAHVSAFDTHGFSFDRGFGRQIGLPLQYWHVEAVNARQLALFEVSA